MADSTQAEETLTHLHRLASKPGVQSTLILSRTDGAIVRASGLLVDSGSTSSNTRNGATNGDTEDTDGSATPNGRGEDVRRAQNRRDDKAQLRNADDVARAVWKFFGAAGGCVGEMVGNGSAKGQDGKHGKDAKEGEDEVRLLRMRLRRSEVVVVPDPKFLLVVVHETPPA